MTITTTTTDVDLELIAAGIRHHADCADPSRWRLRRNTHVVCVACGRWQPVATPHQDDESDTQAEIEQPTASWRCGQHLDQRVSWHGRDCPQCADDLKTWRAGRAAHRAAIRAKLLARIEAAKTSPRGHKQRAARK